jgi:hypothetical protein
MWMSSGLLRRAGWLKPTDVSEVPASFIMRAIIEVADVSETSVNFHKTIRRNNPEDSHLYSLQG